jgi:hypothetical protein
MESELAIMKKKTKLYKIVNNVCVNKFFYRRLLSVIGNIVIYLEKFKDQKRMLVVSGYSLGGIMAHIAAAIFGRMFPNLYVKCHTFGSPKPGNDEFALWFSECVKENYRIINGTDPIVLFPLNYKWSHTEMVTLHFGINYSIHIYYHRVPWYKRLFLTRHVIRKILKKKYNKYDHHFDVYILRLWRYVRITSYLYSISEAEVFTPTPI